MTHSKYISLIGTMAVAFAANALDVNLTAGQLKNAEIPADETALTISGTIDASDFSYIFDNLNQLESLDLSNAQIVAYQGDILKYTGLNNSPANTLPAYALTGLINIKSITLPRSLKVIGKGSLSGTGISAISIPASVTEIQDYALLRCPNLVSVTIPANVTTIGTRALAYCANLSEVDLQAAIPSVPEGMLEACGGLRQLSLEGLAKCTEIGAWALADCNGVKTLILPDDTEAIGDEALFGASGIAALVLPSTVNYIGNLAMANMTGLENISVADIPAVPDLGENVWSGVKQSDVRLITPEGQEDDYRNADQWKEFNIEDKSATQNVSSSVGNPEFKVIVSGGELVASVGQGELGHVAIFDAAGHRMAATQAQSVAKFNVGGWPHGVYLVVSQLGAVKVSI